MAVKSDETVARRDRIAFAGASGSHPEMIRLISAALVDNGARLPLAFDLSAFDRRGSADYEFASVMAVKPEPAEAEISSRFATAAPNIVISGGVRAFDRLQTMFGALLDRHRIGVLMLCHSWGFPEQALARSARDRGIPVFQVDEGPFSLPLRGTRVPETSRRSGRFALKAMRLFGLLPPRDMSGGLIDRVLVTAQGRYDRLVERGVDPAKISVVPPPRFDRLAHVAEAWPNRKTDDRQRRIIWLHQPFRADGKVRGAEVDRAEKELALALQKISATTPVKVIPRLHPRSDENERERVLTLLRAQGLLIQEQAPKGLYDTLLEADAAVGFYSSALLEAAVCTMPVVAARLNPDAFDQATEAAKAQAMATLGVPVADEADALAGLLATGLAEGTRPVPPQLLSQEIGWLNGKGAATVAAMLLEALADNPARQITENQDNS